MAEVQVYDQIRYRKNHNLRGVQPSCHCTRSMKNHIECKVVVHSAVSVLPVFNRVMTHPDRKQIHTWKQEESEPTQELRPAQALLIHDDEIISLLSNLKEAEVRILHSSFLDVKDSYLCFLCSVV